MLNHEEDENENQHNDLLNTRSNKNYKDFIVLGFDFGMKSIGVAVGQSVTMSSKPLTSLRAIDGIPNWQEVEKIIKNWQPNFLVVGMPLHMDSSESEISSRAKKFSNRLAEKFKISVEMIDERLSTKEAEGRLKDSNIKKFNKGMLDAASASVIVDAWFKTKY